MDDLIKEREKAKQIELLQTKNAIGYIKQCRQRFDYADSAQWIAQDKNLEDLTIVSNAISEWVLNPKLSDGKRQELTELLQSIWRVMAYCQNLETVAKSAVQKYVITENRNDELLAELTQLKLKYRNLEVSTNNTIESLGKEIEFLSK